MKVLNNDSYNNGNPINLKLIFLHFINPTSDSVIAWFAVAV